MSNDVANRKLNRVVVVPITSATSRIYPSEAEVLLAGLPGKATADQIRTASKSRLMRVIGSLSTAEITALDLAIRIHLGLD